MLKPSPHSFDARESDDTLAFLQKWEEGFLRAIHGVPVFIYKKIPAIARRCAAWLRKSLDYTYLVAVRVVRVAGLGVAWLALVFGPLVFFFGWLSALWALLALAGSLWGVDRQIRKGQSIWSMWKEDVHA